MTPDGRIEAQQIETLVGRCADAVHVGDLDTVVQDHADDSVMFDVPPPDEGVRGLAAYRDLSPPFFEWQRQGATFEITELEVAAGQRGRLRLGAAPMRHAGRAGEGSGQPVAAHHQPRQAGRPVARHPRAPLVPMSRLTMEWATRRP